MRNNSNRRSARATLLIDGYNLLYASDVLAPAGGGTELSRVRTALLDRLERILDLTTRRRTVVVFDGRDAPPGLPKVLRHGALLVRFADRDREADELLETLIGQNSAPRALTVVSSDHRVQRAARPSQRHGGRQRRLVRTAVEFQ